MRRAFLFGLLAAVPAAGLPPAAADDPAPTANQLKLSANNLKQIALAMHLYQDTHRELPNNVYKDGKALLNCRNSWSCSMNGRISTRQLSSALPSL